MATLLRALDSGADILTTRTATVVPVRIVRGPRYCPADVSYPPGMPRKPKAWNQGKQLLPELHGKPPAEVPEHLRRLDERVSVGHSTAVHFSIDASPWAALGPEARQRVEVLKFREIARHWFDGVKVEGWHLCDGVLEATTLRPLKTTQSQSLETQ